MNKYKIEPSIRIKQTDDPNIFEVSGFKEETFSARIHSCSLSALTMHQKTSDMSKIKGFSEVQSGIVEGQHALIEGLNGRPVLYTTGTIEKIVQEEAKR